MNAVSATEILAPGHDVVTIRAVLLDAVNVQYELLSEAERSRAKRLAQPELAQRFIARRVALKRFAADILGVDAAGLENFYSCPEHGTSTELDHGAPAFLVNQELAPLSVSLSSSGPWAVMAALPWPDQQNGEAQPSTRPRIGVDLESVGKTNFAGFDDIALTDRERAFVAGAADPARARAQAWVGKEAWAKASGAGIRADPNQIESLREQIIALDPAELGVPESFVAALAVLPGNASEVSTGLKIGLMQPLR